MPSFILALEKSLKDSIWSHLIDKIRYIYIFPYSSSRILKITEKSDEMWESATHPPKEHFQKNNFALADIRLIFRYEKSKSLLTLVQTSTYTNVFQLLDKLLFHFVVCRTKGEIYRFELQTANGFLEAFTWQK